MVTLSTAIVEDKCTWQQNLWYSGGKKTTVTQWKRKHERLFV